jgi:hypothetical protein
MQGRNKVRNKEGLIRTSRLVWDLSLGRWGRGGKILGGFLGGGVDFY